jgi:chemotaxis response regulator CheB
MAETIKINCIIVDDETEALLRHFEQIHILSKEWDAERAIQAIVDTVPDIVFFDVEMPKYYSLAKTRSILTGGIY